MPPSVVVAYDVGTSGVKAVVVDAGGRVLGSGVQTYGMATPRPGWVEQDLDAMVGGLGRASREALAAAGVGPGDVAAVGLTGQMFSIVPVDRAGQPLRPMISWLDQRSDRQAAALRGGFPADQGYRMFDGVLTAKDIVPRIRWLLDEEPALDDRTAWYLDCKEAMVARLTGQVAIDPAGASAFRLVDPHSGAWDPARCQAAGVPIDRLPPIRPATDVVGRLDRAAAALTGLPEGTPVVTGAGDVPASQIGAGATGPGATHLSLGTAVYLGITLDRPVADPAAHLGPLTHVVRGQWLLWLEIATGGAALSWLHGQLQGSIGSEPRDHAAIDRAVEGAGQDMDGLLFAPWLTGERVPMFDDTARAAFVGLGLHHRPAHLIRAVMEGVACQIALAYEYGRAYGIEPDAIRAVGGGSIGSAWTAIIAETLGQPLEIVAEPQDAGARGAAACALVGAGLAADLATAVPARVERTVVPDPTRCEQARRRLDRFRGLPAALRPWGTLAGG
jgi:xylulokinase